MVCSKMMHCVSVVFQNTPICVLLCVPVWQALRFRNAPFLVFQLEPFKLICRKGKNNSECQGLSQAYPARSATDLVTMIGHWFFSVPAVCELRGESDLFLLLQWSFKYKFFGWFLGAHKFVISEYHPISFPVVFQSCFMERTSGLFKKGV